MIGPRDREARGETCRSDRSLGKSSFTSVSVPCWLVGWLVEKRIITQEEQKITPWPFSHWIRSVKKRKVNDRCASQRISEERTNDSMDRVCAKRESCQVSYHILCFHGERF